MLLLKSSKPASFKLLNASSNSPNFKSSHCIFHYDQKVLKCFFSIGDFFRSKKIIVVKKLLNSLAMPYGFCVTVLSTLISWRRRLEFVFIFPVISFITFISPLRICFMFVYKILNKRLFQLFFLVFRIDFCRFCN